MRTHVLPPNPHGVQVGSFTMGAPGGQKAGPPPVVKKVLSLFGSKREEDKMVGYLSFLKVSGARSRRTFRIPWPCAVPSTLECKG